MIVNLFVLTPVTIFNVFFLLLVVLSFKTCDSGLFIDLQGMTKFDQFLISC